LLWWNTLAETLFKEGFKLNPYVSCVTNKALPSRSQITICWYNDLEISSIHEEEVSMKVIKTLDARYGVVKKSLGNKHGY